MLIRIGDFDCSEVWDGVFFKKLSRYPRVSDWEMRTIIEFIQYEERHGRSCRIECADGRVLQAVQEGLAHREEYLSAPRPPLLQECTACPVRKGCVTAHVCHTTSADNAALILRCGRLLSALRARQVPVETLMQESRNAAHDPADYFEYVMFTWGNCQAGDRLVMERRLGRFPDETDLSVGFEPGVRFYFRYDQLAAHPGAVCDGVLPVKVRDEVILADWVFRIVIPETLRAALTPCVPAALADRVLWVENDCRDIWEWSEKVYRLIERCAGG